MNARACLLFLALATLGVPTTYGQDSSASSPTSILRLRPSGHAVIGASSSVDDHGDVFFTSPAPYSQSGIVLQARASWPYIAAVTGGATSSSGFVVLNSSGTNLMMMRSDGRLGVNLASPAEALDVFGKIRGVGGPNSSMFAGDATHYYGGGANLSRHYGSAEGDGACFSYGAVNSTTCAGSSYYYGGKGGGFFRGSTGGTYAGGGAGLVAIGGNGGFTDATVIDGGAGIYAQGGLNSDSTRTYAGYFAGKVMVNGSAAAPAAANMDRLHIAGTTPGGVTIETAGLAKGRLTTAVNDWIGMTVNAYMGPSGWLLDDPAKAGWFTKLDVRSGIDAFAVWRIPPGAGVHEDDAVSLFNVSATGKVTAAGTISARYQDVAEWVPSAENLEPGTVVVVDLEQNNTVRASAAAYDTAVAGVVSATPGLLLGVEGEAKEQVATTGRVKVKVDATRGAIRLGDLLVTSDKPGTAMKSEPMTMNGRTFHQPGTIIGKALEPLASGTGEILVLLSLQ
jgi:hypothetical protein